MNGEGKESKEVKMEEAVTKERVVFMWGYLPGALPQRTPLLSPVNVRIPASAGCSWTDVCGGGCGFAMAISGTCLFSSFNFSFFSYAETLFY